MVDPVNYQSRDLDQVDSDVSYAKETFLKFMTAIEKCGGMRADLQLLELGPGSDFGAQLLLASTGVHITLADRYLAKWDPKFHPFLYRRLYDSWDGPKGELSKALEAGGYEGTRLTLIEEPAEDLASLADASFDIVYSNAVLEHIVDLAKVASETARVVRPGGYGYHKIDWRYHRDFSRPIDHLLMKESIFLIAAEDALWEFGNRYRSIEFWNHFEAVGLQVIERIVTDRATPNYLDEVTPSLRNTESSYRMWPALDLDQVSGFIVATKLHGPAATVLRERARDTLALIESLKTASLDACAARQKLASIRRQDEPVDIAIDPTLAERDGMQWSIPFPALPAPDRLADAGDAPFKLFEGDNELGPAHAPQEDIKNIGRGRFAHANGSILFSTSDNSSPKENGRRYAVRVPERLFAAKRRWDDATTFEIDPATAEQNGMMWSVAAPSLPAGDSVDDNFKSPSQLFEDGKELGPAHALHADIISTGRGRFAHWNDSVLFSTSDNSSPKENGRRYVVRVPDEKAVPVRNYADAIEIEINPRLARQDGLMWSITIPDLPAGDTGADAYGAHSRLFEDGDELGPAHSLHEHIKTSGRGRFSHWNDVFFFSTSDNSSPKENGRRYVLRVPKVAK